MKLTAIMMSLVAVVLTVNATAASTSSSDMEKHEIIFNMTRGTGANLSIGGQATGGDSVTSMGIQGGYMYHVMPGIEVGLASFGLNYVSQSGVSATGWDFLAGVTLNWPMSDKIDDAAFVTLGAGLKHFGAVTVGTVTSAAVNKFQFGAEVGKRFAIADHINYRPSVQFLKVSDYSAQFIFNVLAFSAAF